MSVLAAENGRAYALTDTEWIDYLEARVGGQPARLCDDGVDVGAFVTDVTNLTDAEAATLLAAAKGALMLDAA